jgi:predicted small secreted protein
LPKGISAKQVQGDENGQGIRAESSLKTNNITTLEIYATQRDNSEKHSGTETTMIRKFVMIIALGSAVVLAGCNTVKGLGRDIESVGKAGEKAI